MAQKLRIKEGFVLKSINAPSGFKKSLEPLPSGVKVETNPKKYNQVHCFVKNKAELNSALKNILDKLEAEVVCWIYYPKGSSGIQTDLTRDRGWEMLYAHDELHWLSLISFDETWSVFAFRLKAEADKKKKEKAKERPVFQYVDPVKKTVNLPEDFAKALVKSKRGKLFFDTLSFSNRKEYIEWIVSAKRTETRTERVRTSVERLEKSWKNPRNL